MKQVEIEVRKENLHEYVKKEANEKGNSEINTVYAELSQDKNRGFLNK